MLAVVRKVPPSDLHYLLDTNILIHAVRRGPTWERIRDTYNPLMSESRPLISVVTEGELRSFAEQAKWSEQKRDHASWLIGYFQRINIDSAEVIDAYALLDNYSRGVGVRMGKNDLWIAATAAVYEAALLTMDRDFDHLQDKFLQRVLIGPS